MSTITQACTDYLLVLPNTDDNNDVESDDSDDDDSDCHSNEDAKHTQLSKSLEFAQSSHCNNHTDERITDLCKWTRNKRQNYETRTNRK